MRYQFDLFKKGDKFYAKGVNTDFYTQANSHEELNGKLNWHFKDYIKRTFWDYDEDGILNWEYPEGSIGSVIVYLPADFAFDLIMRHIENNVYPGGKERLARDMGYTCVSNYEAEFVKSDTHKLSILDKVRWVMPYFPFEWLIK